MRDPDPGPPPHRRGRGRRVGKVADQRPHGVGGQGEVGLEDPRERAGLEVHRPRQPRHPRAVLHGCVGDVGLAVGVGAEVVDEPQVRALDRLEQLAGVLHQVSGRQGLVELPVGVYAAGAAGLDEQVTGPVGQEPPEGGQLAGPVDVDPQPPRVRDGVLRAPRLGSDGGGGEHLLAALGVPSGEREQPFQPALLAAGAAGQEVVAALPGADPQVAAAAGAGRELHQPVADAVQHPELQRPVALRRERAREDAPVAEAHPAPQPYGRGRPGARRVCGRGGNGRRHTCCSLSVQGPRGKRAIRVDVVVGRGSDPGCCLSARRRRSVTPGAARRAERGALDRRRAGAIGRWLVRAGARPYLGPRPGVAPGRRHDGCWGDPADCGAAARSFRAVHERVAAGACRELAAVHRCE